jgi:glucose/arabinose dehydrogenase
MLLIITLMVIILNCFIFYTLLVQTAHAQPYISDASLNVEPAVEGLSFPTSMVFLDDNNIIVLEKEGNVRLVSNGILREEPLLHVPVDTEIERGLLGIAVVNGTGDSGADNTVTNILLYYTEANPLRNRVYKYEWTGQSLINPTLILDLPAEPGPHHDGGKIIIGPDGYLYGVIGDLHHDGQLQNFPDGPPPDDTGVIFRVNPEDGSAAHGNPFPNSGNANLSKYYAYGIRNSFGLNFDPLTNNLWDTENGPGTFDEINLVRPGFNGGWEKVMGPISLSGRAEDDLVSFPGSNYSDPMFNWREPVGLTDLEFFTSAKLGDKYTNNIFVGDINRGNIYFFELNKNRDGIKLDNAQKESGLSDRIVDSKVIKGAVSEEELSTITFGTGFGGITDIETGPDGLLYLLSYGDGTIYKISPSINLGQTSNTIQAQGVPAILKTDDPFIVAFSIAGVNNHTGYVINWVTANNVTRSVSYNASGIDLEDTHPKDGFISTGITLPNGTMNIGDKYKACTMVPGQMYRVCSIGFNWPTTRHESISVTIPNLNGTTNSIHAQRTQTIDEGPFLVEFLIAGVDNNTDYVVNWVTANNVTNVVLHNASDFDLNDNRKDGFIETSISLPNGTMHMGDKYKACTKALKDDYLICNEGFNWPDDRVEFNSVILP